MVFMFVFFLMRRRPPRTNRTATPFPYTTLCRLATPGVGQGADRVPSGSFAPASWREQKVPFPHYIAEACHQRLPPATCLPCVAERRPFGQAHSPGSRRRSR